MSAMARKFAQAIRLKLLSEMDKLDKKQAAHQAEVFQRSPITGQAPSATKKYKKKQVPMSKERDCTGRPEPFHRSNVSVQSANKKRLQSPSKQNIGRSTSPDVVKKDKMSFEKSTGGKQLGNSTQGLDCDNLQIQIFSNTQQTDKSLTDENSQKPGS